MAMERANLLNMAKLSIKGLIESALSFGRTLDSDYPPLQQFFVVMEHCLKHGLKGMFNHHQTASHREPSVNQLSLKVLGWIADVVKYSVVNISFFHRLMLVLFLGTRHTAATANFIIGRSNEEMHFYSFSAV